ncbi:Ger(x)C family spore germination C-terminal domain-containing protein [Paenibacillus sp. ACRRX]|uniref:Ger(x)C family spore germination C-terminal domain-containing protein n=1 Tax=Paenibacillus sp. ACRRX TaxID=2918206 RepID=UPI001EF6922A|nr:Ger(x)C family spore germination C-terminal domain-containing protein [Paenibacillus sp. ACRRX]MCG7406004.1 Ger(x)C family spore germination C-terminal domain-containing protein [Paenibacillus sp. ACRRX]
MKRVIMTMLVLVALASLTVSCQAKRIINQNGYIQTITIDKTDDPNQYFFGIMYAEPLAEGKAKSTYQGYMAHDFTEAYNHFTLQSRFALVVGHVRNIIISREIAESDVIKVISNLLFQPKFPLTSRILVYEGQAKDFLQQKEDLTDFHLYLLLEKLQKINDYSLSTVFNFVRDQQQLGIEPITSIVKLKNDAVIGGMSLFRGGKMIGIVPEKEVNYMLLLRNHSIKGAFYINENQLPGNEPIILDNAKSRRSIEVVHTAPVPKIIIRLHITSTLTTPMSETTPEDKISEALIQETLQRKFNQFVQSVQEKEADVIGVGMHVRNKMRYSEWNEAKWPKLFKNADIKCIVRYYKENEI